MVGWSGSGRVFAGLLTAAVLAGGCHAAAAEPGDELPAGVEESEYVRAIFNSARDSLIRASVGPLKVFTFPEFESDDRRPLEAIWFLPGWQDGSEGAPDRFERETIAWPDIEAAAKAMPRGLGWGSEAGNQRIAQAAEQAVSRFPSRREFAEAGACPGAIETLAESEALLSRRIDVVEVGSGEPPQQVRWLFDHRSEIRIVAEVREADRSSSTLTVSIADGDNAIARWKTRLEERLAPCWRPVPADEEG